MADSTHSTLCNDLHAPVQEHAGSSAGILLFGYGNIDRQDDGVAWHTLRAVALSLGQPLPEQPGETFFHLTSQVDCTFALQLVPEDADLISKYQRVCFVDAHTGRVADLVHWEALDAKYEPSPFTHHLTAATCLSMAKTVYQATPQAALISIRGYEFGFSQQLSEQTQILVSEAVRMITNWINA